MAQHYRILLAEDHVIFRELIKKNLKEIPGLEVVGEVGDGLELLESLNSLRPQMILLDIGLPRLSGLDAAQKIKQKNPKIKILLLTMHKSRDHFTRALEVGVDGYLLKEDAFNDLVIAIKTIREGGPYISKLLYQQVLARWRTNPKNPRTPNPCPAGKLRCCNYLPKANRIRKRPNCYPSVNPPCASICRISSANYLLRPTPTWSDMP
jgi:DNA-binding NarL/FixJ family response regulator